VREQRPCHAGEQVEQAVQLLAQALENGPVILTQAGYGLDQP
jgi:hypothetical protein